MPAALNLNYEKEHVQALAPEISLLPPEEVLQRLNTKLSGLTKAQADERIVRHGLNTISVRVPIPIAGLLRENFLHTMALLLWGAGGIAFVARMPELGIAIWLVNVVNGTFSFWQEFRAEKATEALQQLLPASVQVIRGGENVSVRAENLVPGDVLVVNEGDKISADARIVSAESLEVDQSTLTGEFRPVRKSVSSSRLGLVGLQANRTEIANLLFAGTTVLTGHGLGVVYATGTSTEFGRIAHLTQTISDQPSPLQQEMKRVTRIVTGLALSIGAVIFGLAIGLSRNDPAQAFIFAMGIVVAFVPEGMVPTVTLSLALAVQRMAKRNALVKRLSSVEALGCTNVICTDKTGTLTQNKMIVTRAFAGDVDYNFTELSHSADDNCGMQLPPTPNEASVDLKELLTAGALCNNAKCKGDKSNIGDPTEIAIVVAAAKLGLLREQLEQRTPRLHENPFESHRKCMSTVHEVDAKRVAYIKGSPGQVLERSVKILLNGQEILLDDSTRQAILNRINMYAGDGLRVIAAAKREMPSDCSADAENAECDLTFLGAFGMFDPPHKEVPDAVKRCREAGIKVVMVTGDYEVTAEAIARKVGILSGESARVITGIELDRMSDPELVELLTGEIVFARVNPEHKLRVVQAFQRCGKIVAVTGDGVNDAPALKKADIGVAMGQNGTDVAREAADIILLDDNFASIVNAVQEGRAVYDNIKKFAVYVFNSNMAEAVPFVVMLLSCGLIPMPLTVMQVLSIDLGTDMVPAIGLGADQAEEDIMQRRPRSRSQPLLSRALLIKALLWYGGIEAVAGLSGYFFENYLHGWPQVPLAVMGTPVWQAATTMTLTCIVASQIGAVFCCRTEKRSILSRDLLANKLILVGVVFEIVLLACLIYVPPLQRIFNTAALGLVEFGFAFIWMVTIVCLDEARKFLLRRTKGC